MTPQSFKSAQQEEDEFWDHVATIVTIVIVVVSLTVIAHCQQFPDAPSKADLAVFAMNAGLRVGDVVQTCIALSNGGREYMLPSQHCAADAAFILAGIPAQMIGVRIARHYSHPWIARAILWGFPLGSAYAIASSSYHWHDPLPRRRP